MKETINYRGFEIEILTYTSPQNPRKEWDNFGHMVCWHRRYDLGDEHNHGDSRELFEELSGLSVGRLEKMTEQQVFDAAKKNAIIMPLYLYDHSGITMSTGRFSCPWDSGQVGWIYATKEDVCSNWGVSHWGKWVKHHTGKKIRAKDYAKLLLEGEVETYDNYLTGEVYGYDWENGGCWGYFGDHGKKAMIEEAKAEIDAHIKYERIDAIKSHIQQLKTWIKNKVPMAYRQAFELPFANH